MLEISVKQMNAFQAGSQDAFIARVSTFLTSEAPPLPGMTTANVGSWVRGQVERANQYGLFTEGEAVSFVLAAYYLGADFTEHSKIKSYLTSDQPPERKAEFLDAVVLATDDLASDASPAPVALPVGFQSFFKKVANEATAIAEHVASGPESALNYFSDTDED